ncbi:TonB-dependent receptor domain-containing protein [Leptospira ilyithenensis]|uniref:TonB-dependent receptor n=1 Tax=Leptospira ilyithenensis TaxID=2484901 RepID=A0A4R9LP64_9LEPT|nr:TonB-dependent receptor [Leptospira ilyithenensis]TGN10874.1 TonB-dependent receptor [Leptospira ilyithenensis]
MKNVILSIIIILLFPITLFAQGAGNLRGTIIDSENGEAVFGATIVVRSEKKFAKTDFDGKYDLSLPPGSYEVEYQMYGYAPQKRTINIIAGKTQSMNVTFGAQTLETVEVKDRAINNTEASMLALQRKSATVSDGISQEAIKKSPDSSAGDVVRRVTGITLIGGKYVFVRGLGERYSNTLLNDSIIPSTEPDKRVVPLDIFPAGLIKNIRVIKTFQPEDIGEFSGGLVKIETQEYPDQFQMSLSLGVGRNMNTTGKEFKTFNGGDFLGRANPDMQMPKIISGLPNEVVYEPGNRFGGLPATLTNITPVFFNGQWTPKTETGSYDKNFSFSIGNTFKITESGQRLGVLVGITRSEEYRFREEKSRRYNPSNPVNSQVKETTQLNKVQEQDADIYNKETNFGSNVNLAYEFTKGQSIHFKNLYTINSDTNVRQSSGVNYIDNFQFLADTNTFTSRSLLNSTFGGDHAIQLGTMARPHKLDWNLSFSEATRDEPNLTQQVWRRSDPPSSPTQAYLRLGNNPDGSRFFSVSKDQVKQINVKYEIPFEQWNGLKSSLKVGGLAMDRYKDFRFREFGVKYNSAIGNNIADYWPAPGELTYNASEFLVTRDNPSGKKTFSERQIEPNAYDAMQKLQASFAQFDLPLMPKLRFVGGVRFEDSYQKVKTFRLRDSSSIANLDYGCGDTNNEDVRVALVNSNICRQDNNGVGEIRTKDRLPSANFVYEVHKDMNLRLGYTQTITRPDLRELSPFGFTPYFGADRIFGNPNLNRTYIHNYDLRWEYYLTQLDYIGVGVFYKQMSDPIEMIGRPVAGSISAQFTYTNAQQAYIRGIEFDYRKEFLDRFRFETNFFFIKSRVDVLPWSTYALAKMGLLDSNNRAFTYDPTNLSRALQGQSDFVYNLKFDWFITQKKNQTIGVYYNYFGNRIYAVGANGTPDAIERGVGLTDIVYSYKHDERLDLKAAAKNIMDTRFKVYQRSELTGQDELFLSYRMGVTFTVAATYKFN